jgi:hypothetical protein
MGHLYRQIEDGCYAWSSGFASFLISHREDLGSYPVAVKCRIGSLDETDLALLDTGAEWTVVGGDTAKILGDEIGSPSEHFVMSTRLGKIPGALYRINITLLAGQHCGQDLTVEGTVFVSQDWPGPTVLGYRGFLERIRIALDPGVKVDEQTVFFGLAE